MEDSVEQALQSAQVAETQAKEDKKQVIETALLAGKITVEYKRLLDSMGTETTMVHEATLDKVRMVLDLRGQPVSDQLSQGEVVYVGSGLDWQLPVALGARSITMLDLRFASAEATKQLMASIQEQASNMRYDGTTISFTIDLGSGPEAVTLHLAATTLQDYQPNTPLAGAIEYCGPTAHSTTSPIASNIAPHLRPGSIILNSSFGFEAPQGIEAPQGSIIHTSSSGDTRWLVVTDASALATAAAAAVRPKSPNLSAIKAAAG